MKNFRIHLSVLLVFAAAFAGYFSFGDFGLQQRSVEITELPDQAGQANQTGQTGQTVEQDRLAAGKESRPDIAEISPSTPEADGPEVGETGEKKTATDKPSFDVVRVEPTGDTLIAGQAAPHSKILIEKNGKVIAETETDAAGAFVALPEGAITGESNQVVIRSLGEDGAESVSDQIVAISVPEEGEALVALVEPGKAIEILQKPKSEQLTSAAPLTGDVPSKEDSSQDVASNEALLAEKAAKNALVAALENKSDSDVKQTIEGVVEAEAEETKRVARLLKSDEQGRADDSPEDQNNQKALEDNSLAGEESAELVEAKPESIKEITPSSPALVVSVEAVEVDGEKIFIAGAAKAGKSLRVYVDGEAIGDVKADDKGRWLYENKKDLPPGEHSIRVDQITTATGEVSARAEVPFVVEDRSLSDLAKTAKTAKTESNTIIIRRNDNLWTIAQRIYGDGLKFTAIYEQNRDQIRNPDLIFPGQTFTLPVEGRKAQPQN